MATTTNYSFPTPDDTDLVKDGASAIRSFGTAVDTQIKNLSPGTTAGDIDYYTTSTAKARIGIGTAGQVLAVNSGATAPEWVTSSSGGMTLLSTTTLSGLTTTISGISGSYTDLRAVIFGVTNATDTGSITCLPNATNNISDVVYTNSSNTLTNSANSVIRICGASTNGSLYTSNANSFILNIRNYASTTSRKPFEVYGHYLNGSSVRRGFYAFGGVNTTSAITSLVFEHDTDVFNGGTVLLYGVK